MNKVFYLTFLLVQRDCRNGKNLAPKKVDLIPVVSIKEHQQNIKCTKSPRNPRIPINFDPRPVSLRHPDPKALEKLRTTLVNLGQPCALLSIIVPCVESIEHDHSYLKHREVYIDFPVERKIIRESCPFSQEELLRQYEEIRKQLQITSYERNRIELATRQQNKSQLWHDVRLK